MHEEKFRGGCGSAGAAGQRTNAVWPNGIGATYDYDDAGQLLSLVHRTASGTPIASFAYAYDIAGNRTNMTTLEGLHSFAYDHRNQLVGAVYPDGSSEGFAYDLVGNRTSLVAVSTNGATNTTYYTYASGNRLVADASETATNTYAYDGAGRLTNHVVNGQTRTFTYNFQGRMTSLTDIDGSVFAYEFDGEGNRLSQSLNDCLSKRFVYDGADVLLELNPTNGVAYAWVNGPGIDQPIERLLFIDGAPRARRVFHADALGSVAALTDSDGLLTDTYAYTAFGAIRSQTGSDPNRVTYTAREQLGDLRGWMYYRSRIYSPRSGRFVSRDALGFVDGVNVWTYIRNFSLRYTDPWGFQATTHPVIDPYDGFWQLWREHELAGIGDNACSAHCFPVPPGVVSMVWKMMDEEFDLPWSPSVNDVTEIIPGLEAFTVMQALDWTYHSLGLKRIVPSYDEFQPWGPDIRRDDLFGIFPRESVPCQE